MRAIILLLSAIVFMGATATAQTSVVKTGHIVTVSERLPGHEPDTYRFGVAYKSLRGTTPGQCEAACNNEQMCASWTLVPATFQMGPRCELKRNIGAQEYRPGAVSGIATKFHPRAKTPQKTYTRPAPAPAPVPVAVPALRRAPAVSTPPAPRPKPVTIPKPAPKPVAPPKPAPKPVAAPVPVPQPSPKPALRPAVRSQTPVQVKPAPAPTRLTRPTQPIVQPQPRASQGLEGGPVQVYPQPRPAPAPVTTMPSPAPRPVPTPLPVTRQPQPAPQPMAPKPAPQPQRPKQFEMQPSAVPAPQPAPRPAPAPQPEPITISPDVTSGGVATEPPAPISQRRRVPWNERTGNEPSYSVGDTDYVPGDEQATAGFLGGAPEEE